MNIFESYESFSKFIRDLMFHLDENRETYTSKDIRIMCSKENIEKFNISMLEKMKSLGFTVTTDSKEKLFDGNFETFFETFNHQDGNKIIFIEINNSPTLILDGSDFILKLMNDNGITLMKRNDIFNFLNYRNE
jgi:hypothetical protein